jgi:hypothetical protein
VTKNLFGKFCESVAGQGIVTSYPVPLESRLQHGATRRSYTPNFTDCIDKHSYFFQAQTLIAIPIKAIEVLLLQADRKLQLSPTHTCVALRAIGEDITFVRASGA